MVLLELARTPASKFNIFKNFILDLDGTVWRWKEPIVGARELVAKLQKLNRRVYFVTNLSVLSRAGFAKKLGEFGIKAEPRQIFTAAYVAAQHLLEQGTSRVYVIGEKGLVDELTEVGIKVTEKDADAILVSMDRNLTYWKLKTVRDLVDANPAIPIFTTGNSRVWVVGDEVWPGDGAILAAVEALAGRQATPVGKPSEIFKQRLLQEIELHAENTLLIGDDLATDVAFGARCGFKTALVLTGVTKRQEALAARPAERPDFILTDLRDLGREL